MTNVAVILSGCGYLDGAEVRESVLSLLYLDVAGANVTIFAPDIAQSTVLNHQTQQVSEEFRNSLIEAARIARGNVQPLSTLDASQFDALVIPGGFGVAKNLSSLATEGADCTILPDFEKTVCAFYEQKKPIAAICIAPAVVAVILKDKGVRLTIGEDKDTASLIESMGGSHVVCASDECVLDEEHHIVSCSAYMREDAIHLIAKGIEKTINSTISMVTA